MYTFLEENNIPYSKNYFEILISDKKIDLHLQEDDFIGLSKELGHFINVAQILLVIINTVL